jgi:hypothetical protein
MSTTGNTKLKTIELIEAAVRRCGKQPEKLTAEQLATCALDAYTVIAHLANNGLQLWCIDKRTFTLVPGQGSYRNPMPGAESIENAVFCQPEIIDTIETTIVTPATTATAQLSDTVQVAAISYTPTASGDMNVVAEVEVDSGFVQVAEFTGTVMEDEAVWFIMDRQVIGTAVRLRELTATAIVAGTIAAASQVNDTPMEPMSRDDYAFQPNKLQANGLPCLYYLERKVTPVLNIYPPTDRTADYMTVWWKRNIQDLTSLSAYIELPTRWYHAVITAIAATLALDLPKVDPALIGVLESKATAAITVAAGGETDNGTARIVPAIAGYTR